MTDRLATNYSSLYKNISMKHNFNNMMHYMPKCCYLITVRPKSKYIKNTTSTFGWLKINQTQEYSKFRNFREKV